MRVILDILLLLPALLYQSALAAHFTYRGVGVDLLAVLLASIAINQGWLYGAVGGFAAGLILDCTFGHSGLYVLQYMALGMFVGLVNERFRLDAIVLPALLMGYLSAGSLTEYASLEELRLLLVQHGWTGTTALCAVLFTLFHFPCGTTCLTIRRETGGARWTALAILLPTAAGVLLCTGVHLISLIFR